MPDKPWYEKTPEERTDAESAEAFRDALKLCEFWHEKLTEITGFDRQLRATFAAHIKEGRTILQEYEAKSHAA